MRINETKKRSLAKAVSFRIVEVIVDALVLSLFVEAFVAMALAIALEGFCLILHYIFERIWNRVSYGRRIE